MKTTREIQQSMDEGGSAFVQGKGPSEFGRGRGDAPFVGSAFDPSEGKVEIKVLEKGEGADKVENFWEWDGAMRDVEIFEGGR